ncbi:MAG: hypothetical protein EON88_31800, partial [Brevundimonas sp.]
MVTIGYISNRAWREAGIPQPRLNALLAEGALQGAQVVMLDASSVDIAAGWIGTDVWDGAGWTRRQAPLPDVVIMLGSPTHPWQQAVYDWVARTRPLIKDKGPNKAQLKALLTGGPCERYLIPDAEIDPARPAASIREFLSAHGGGVIKRANGQRGIGLLFITKDADDWSLHDGKAPFRGSLEAVVDRVVAAISGRLQYRAYVIQRFIRSMASDGRVVDFRIHVQRRADGAFHLTRAFVRLGEAGMMLANTSQGGYQGAIDTFLAQRRVRPGAEIQLEAIDAALSMARLYDATAETPLSELGIDLL